MSRYVAVTGTHVIAEGNDLTMLIRWLEQEYPERNSSFRDIVIWDNRVETFISSTVAASTSRGWLTINVEGRQDWVTEKFGISFTPREMRVLKQLFDVWKLEDGQTVSEVVENLYDQPYVKGFKPDKDQIRLERDEFKVFVNKLLNVVRSKAEECVK